MSKVATKLPNRNTVTTINKDGSHFVIHPSDVQGRYTYWRRIVAYVLIAIFIALPWIPINGYPAVFFDVIQRRFHILGATLAFQDTYLLFFVLSGTAFSLFFITALWGRVWCGWTCPQTVYLEHVYRRVERWIDGDAPARRKLDAAPWNGVKVGKRLLKHSVFIILSFLIAHIFLAYFVSLPGLWERMSHAPGEHWHGFLFVMGATLVLYANFAWFREQLCIIICPYGRFQSVLIDNHSKNVAYDYNRGDPPGKLRDADAGDCIDCKRCVQVCPTGIDIRQGLQLECVGCAACIDACDSIMDKVKRPRGLIRYASDEDLQGRKTQWIRFRTILYTILLFIGIGVATTAFTNVEPIHVTVTRMVGAPFYVTDSFVRNQYQLRLINKSNNPVEFSVSATTAEGGPEVITAGFEQAVVVEPMGEAPATFVVQVPRDAFEGNFPVFITAVGNPGEHTLKYEVEFLGPDPKLLNR
jgi:cytochrome c oxidase accessory protein FixG